MPLVNQGNQSNNTIIFYIKKSNLKNIKRNRWAQLVSLQQVSVVNGLNPSDTSVIDLSIEPAFIALGPDHVFINIFNNEYKL